MATSTLLNFTVPLDGTGETASEQGLLFPKIKNRFRILFNGFGVATNTSQLTRQIVECSRPSVKFEDKEIHVYNSIVKYAGKPSWSPLDLTVRDDAQGTIQSLVGQQMQRQFDFTNQASAVSASDYKFEMLLQTLDGGNGIDNATVLETWDLVGCWLADGNYDQFNYESTDPLTIKLTINFDNAIQTGYGIGMSVPRTSGILAT